MQLNSTCFVDAAHGLGLGLGLALHSHLCGEGAAHVDNPKGLGA